MRLVNKKRHIIRNLIRVLIIAFFVIVALDNIIIHTTVTEVCINDLPGSFDGYRIVQVSDLHNNVYGIGQSYLISCIKAADPDIIVITGDLIDRNTKNVDNAMMFVSKAVEIAPVFYVSGNHEANLPEEYAELVRRMDEAGVSILDNENASVLTVEEESVTLAGITDPAFDWSKPDPVIVDEEIKTAFADVSDDQVKILLSHRPELINVYSKNSIDLVLTGHAHGGQVRLPFIGPLYSPSQGLLPKYTSGLYIEGNTQMYVSRGIGNGIAPFRFNDGPELAVIVLRNNEPVIDDD